MLIKLSTGEKIRYSDAQRRKEMGGEARKSTGKKSSGKKSGGSPAVTVKAENVPARLSLPTPAQLRQAGGVVTPASQLAPVMRSPYERMESLGLLDMAHRKQDPTRELERQQDTVVKANSDERLEELKKDMERRLPARAADAVTSLSRVVPNMFQGRETYNYKQRLDAVEDEVQRRKDAKYYQDLSRRLAQMESVGNDPDFSSTAALGKRSGAWKDAPYASRVGDALLSLERENDWKNGERKGVPPVRSSYEKMTPEERETFYYYVGRKDYDKAADYLSDLERVLNARANGDFEKQVAEFAKAHPVVGAAGSLLTGPASISGELGSVGQAVKNAVTGEYEPVDTNSELFLGPRLQRGLNAGTKEGAGRAVENLTGSKTAGNAASFVTGALMSAGQSAVQAAALGPAGGLASMGASAAGSSSLDALERGASPGEAALFGAISGGVEALTEKFSLDNLIHIAGAGGRKSVKEIMKNIGKQMFVEGSEEVASEVLDAIADDLVLGDRSSLKLYADDLKAAGMDPRQAEQEALKQFGRNIAASFAGGAIAGGVMGAGAEVVANAKYRGDVRRGVGQLSREQRRDIIDMGLKSDPGSRAYKLAVQAVNKSAAGGEVSDGELARIYLEVERQIARTEPERLSLPEPEKPERQSLPEPDEPDAALDEGPERLGLPAPDWDKLDGYNPELSEADEQRRREYLEEVEKYRPNWGELDEIMAGAEAENLNGGVRDEQQRGERVPDGSQGREFGAGAGEQAEELAAGPGRAAALAQQRRTAVDRQSRLQHLRSQKVSSLDLGLSQGTSEASVSVIQEADWDDELRNTAQRVQKETGLPVTFVMGKLQVQDAQGGVQNVRGVFSQNGIILQADNLGASADQIADHEIFHSKAFQTPGLVRDVELRIQEKYGEEEFSRVVERYVQRLHGMVDVTENSSPEEIEAAMRTIREEILADAYAGINAFAAHADRYQGDVEQVLEEQGIGRGKEFAAAVDRANGPPNEMFSVEYDENNRPYVVVEEDILDGVPRGQWSKTVRNALKQKFPNGVQVGNNIIKINSKTGREIAYSENAKWLAEHDEGTYANKLRAVNNANEILLASKDYVNEGLKHPRKDSFKDFSRGTVQMRIGDHDYTADVVVGSTANGDMVLYDLLNLKPTAIQERSRRTIQPNQTESRRSGAPASVSNIAQPSTESKTKTQSPETFSEAIAKQFKEKYSADDDAEQDQKSKPKGLSLPTVEESIQRDREKAAKASPPKPLSLPKLPGVETGQSGRDSQTEQKKQKREKRPAKKKKAKTKEKSKPTIAKRELKNNLLSLFSIPAGHKAELGGIIEEYADRMLANGELTIEDREAFFDRMYEEGVMTVPADEYYSMARQMLQDRRVYVSEKDRHEFGDDWNDFRKRAFANGIYLTSSPSDAGVDSWNAELAEELPGLFYAGDLDNRSILERIVQVAEEGKDEEMSLADYTAQLAGQDFISEDEALDNMERQMDWALHTFAEKAGLEVELRDRAAAKLERAEREKQQALHRQQTRGQRQLEREKEKGRAAVEQERERGRQQLKKEKAKSREAVERQKERDNERLELNMNRAQSEKEAAVERQRERDDERLDRNMQKAKADKKSAIQKLRDAKNQRFDQARAAAAADKREALKNQRDRYLLREAKDRQRRRQMRQDARDRRELSELSKKTLKQLQWLSRNRDKAPADLRQAFDDVLGDIDIYAASMANDKYRAKWEDLAQIYKDARENDPNFMLNKELEEVISRLDKKKIKDMDIDELKKLYEAAVQLHTEFQNRNKVIGDERNRLISEVYKDSKREIEEAAGGYRDKLHGLDKTFNLEQLTPMNVLERMGGWNPNGAFYTMAKQLEQGERDIRDYTVRANRCLEKFLTEHEDWVKKADGQGKDAVWYELRVPELLELKMGDKPIFGETISVWMTPSQKVHLYLESKNQDNLRHMLGGRTFVNKELYSRGKRQEAFAQGTTIRLAPETVKKLVSDLTPVELELAQALEQYYNGFAKDEINRVSNALYGYDKAAVHNYAPIYNDENYVNSKIGLFDVTAEGVGHLKERQHSQNPSYNIGAFDAFERNVDQAARFVGMSIPARNWKTLLNWRDKDTSMKKVITRKWGGEGTKYIDDLLTNLQGGKDVPGDTVGGFFDKVLSNYIASVFGANPSIVLKQLGSIPLASAYLGVRNAPNPAQIANIDTDLINTYTSDLAWRTMGYSSPETKLLKENPNWTETNKFTKTVFGGGAITAMDGWAASVLWPWAENKVRREFPELEIGTKSEIEAGLSPFYKVVASEFNDAVSRSQSVSDQMHQGTFRKSKNPFTRAFTLFKSDSAQGYNALRQKIGEAQFYARSGDRKAARTARRGVGTAFLALVGGYAWAELVNFLMNLWKRKGKKYQDDEGKLTLQSIGMEVGMGLVGDMAGLVVGGEEIAELIGVRITGDPWYGINMPGMEQIQDMIEAVQKSWDGAEGFVSGAVDVVKEGGDLPKYFGDHWQDLAGAVKNAAFTASTYIARFPANNLEAYILGGLQWVCPEAKTAYDSLWKSAKKKDLKELSGRELASQVDVILSGRLDDVSTDAATEVAGLYEAGFSQVIPADVPKKISVNSEDRELSPAQKQTYETVWRESVGQGLEDVVGQDWYQGLDQENRAKVLAKLYDYAAQKAKHALFNDFAVGKFVEDFDGMMGDGLDLADCLEVWQTGKSDEDGDGAVESAERFAAINASGMSENEKVAAIGSILGTDLTTKSGGKSQYALLLDALDEGFSVGEWLQLKEAGCMSESAFEKVRVGRQYGISAEKYVRCKELMKSADEDNKDPEKRNGSVDAQEAAAAINRLMGLSNRQKAALWQVQNKSWKPEKNPFDKGVGKKIYQTMHEDEK